MPKILFVTVIMTFFISVAPAMQGKLFLKSGSSVTGDIRKLDDGGYWVTDKSGSVKYDRDEVKSVKIISTRDSVTSNFVSSLKITPGHKNARAAGPPTQYDGIIAREAAMNSMDPALVKAVIKAESNYRHSDVSSKGACGLMQLMPETAKLMGVKQIFSPEENIQAGTRFLRYMLDEFNGDIELGLAAYNAGPSKVKKYGTVPPYKETRGYINNVFRYYRAYGGRERKINSYTDQKGCLYLYNTR